MTQQAMTEAEFESAMAEADRLEAAVDALPAHENNVDHPLVQQLFAVETRIQLEVNRRDAEQARRDYADYGSVD
jgi:hypothetical protein